MLRPGRSKRLRAALCLLFSTSIAGAQQAENPRATRNAELAKILDPAEYGPAFYLGAQAEITVPRTGATALSGIAFGYDAVALQIELSLSMVVGGDALLDEPSDDVYSGNLRLALPIHRGIRADFALLALGGAVLVHPLSGGIETIGQAGAGARFRVFMTPDVAVAAAMGGVVLIRGGNSSFFLSARPLGSASVVYFFR